MSSPDIQPSLYRIIWPGELHLIEEHLIRLAPEDRKMRFCGTLNAEAIHLYCAGIDWSRTTVTGCFIDGQLRGIADLVLMPATYKYEAELAITVEKPFQDQGIGTALLGKSLDLARNRFITTAHLYCLSDNVKMRHIAKKFEATFNLDGPDVDGTLSPPWPTYRSLIEEAALNSQAIWSATFNTTSNLKPAIAP
ncbi:MAG: GNAT family N-acetyltransferase [Rhodospirillales bacterium]